MQTFHQAIVLLDYQVNTQSYLKECENKARPQMHCNGQCKLMKKLKKQAEEEEKNTERKAENRSEIALFTEPFTPVERPVVLLSTARYIIASQGTEVRMPRSLLRPPICG